MGLFYSGNSASRFSRYYTITAIIFLLFSCSSSDQKVLPARQKISINRDWKFYKYKEGEQPDDLIYDVRPELKQVAELRVADSRPTQAEKVKARQVVLKPWILPSGN